MTKQEFSKAFELAKERSIQGNPTVDLDCFMGYGLPDFKPVIVSLVMVADLIRWQAKYLFGDEWDQHELENIYWAGRRKRFLVV